MTRYGFTLTRKSSLRSATRRQFCGSLQTAQRLRRRASTLNASDRVVVQAAGPTLTLDRQAHLLAKSITLSASGSSAKLGPGALIQGATVDLKTGSGEGPSVALGSLPPGTKPFQVRLVDEDGTPLANKPYHLFFGDVRLEGKTDGEGGLAQAVPESLEKCEILVWPDAYPDGIRHHFHVHLTEFPEYNTLDGIRLRLHGLGYDVGVGDLNLKEIMRAAVRRFQSDHAKTYKLTVNGELDDPTVNAIKAVFGH